MNNATISKLRAQVKTMQDNFSNGATEIYAKKEVSIKEIKTAAAYLLYVDVLEKVDDMLILIDAEKHDMSSFNWNRTVRQLLDLESSDDVETGCGNYD